MVELKLGLRTVDMPYTVRLYDITEEKFDELVDEDTRAELLDGVMIVPSPASPRHDHIEGFLRGLIGFFADEKEEGEAFGPDALIHLATCRKFAPDIFYLKAPPFPLPEELFEGPPDWVIEVLSPSTRDYGLEEKRPAFREAGVKELWFVDPDQEHVIVDRRRKRSYTTLTVEKGRLESATLAGFWINVSWLWMPRLPRKSACLREILRG